VPKKKASPSKKGGRPEHWKDEPDEHDFPAAANYLTLVVSDQAAAALVDGLKRAGKVDRQAKDLLRAGRLTLLPRDDPHVAADLKKVSGGERLSPVLLVRGHAEQGLPLLVADGYHRICASYHLDEDADIPCRMVELP
jgi:hypothetical protein